MSFHYSNNSIPVNDGLIGASLEWKRAGAGWRLFSGKRCFGEVVPDHELGMWRIVLSGARLSDRANLSWARNAVLEAAIRDLAYEARHDPRNCPGNRAVFFGKGSLVRPNGSGAS